MKPLVGIVMGSDSDWPVMQAAAQMLKEFGVPYEARVVSAHRTPDLLFDYAAMAQERDLRAIIAGAGGAAHLPGMLAAKTIVPVLGVPVPSKHLNGLDSLLSIVQMPGRAGCHLRHRRGRRGQRGADRDRHHRYRQRRLWPQPGEETRRFPHPPERKGAGDEAAGSRRRLMDIAPIRDFLHRTAGPHHRRTRSRRRPAPSCATPGTGRRAAAAFPA
jgi:hypothetical protein